MNYFRYDSIQTTTGVSVFLSTYPVVKHTPKGLWIDIYGIKRFIKTDTRKKYACSSIELAKESFIARKRRQIKILKSQLKNAEQALHTLEELCLATNAGKESLLDMNTIMIR